ncbi:MAG TPA: hypothetical protein VGD40_22080 [Chryseosolibacter sp.]
MLADSTIRASTDSLYNKEKNSFDFYFTDIGRNRLLDHRKYLNNKRQYHMVEQFNEGDVAVRTKWLFNDQDEVVKEVTEFFEDSSVYTVLYERDGHLISQKQTKIKKGEFTCEYVI